MCLMSIKQIYRENKNEPLQLIPLQTARVKYLFCPGVEEYVKILTFLTPLAAAPLSHPMKVHGALDVLTYNKRLILVLNCALLHYKVIGQELQES